jgi:5-methylcytosine-specific restriction endonuclease McrA
MRTKYTKENFEQAVITSGNIREVLIKLGLEPKGGNYKIFYSNAKKFGVDVSSFINPSTYGVEKEKRQCITDDLIIKTVKENISYQAVLNSFGLKTVGSNNQWIRTKISKLKLNITHFLGQGHLKGKNHNFNTQTPLLDILVEGCYYTTSRLSKRLVKEGLLKYECSICGIYDWQHSKLVLHLDHINGCNTDNRIDNLRLLCPNCHSQTETYCAKNKGKK